MEKIKINNEIVKMRHAVRQARICVVHKLTREAKKLRTKRGNEQQLQKNKRKAGRLINEVYTLKRIKDDQISKFGILNAKSLQELLENPDTSEEDRIMARLSNQKNLKKIIAQFKESFPNYEQYVNMEEKKFTKGNKKSEKKNTGRRQSVSSRAKAFETISPKKSSCMQEDEVSTDEHGNVEEAEENNKNTSEEENSKNTSEEENNKNTSEEENNKNTSEEESDRDSDSENDLRESDLDSKSILPTKLSIPTSTSNLENTGSKKKKRKKSLSTEDKAKKSKTKDFTKRENDGRIKVVSKEATVKRFAEILQEAESTQENETRNEVVKSENPIVDVGKEVDEFFMKEDGDTYLSLAVTAKDNNDVPSRRNFKFGDESNKWGAKHVFRNNKFFNNIEAPVMPKYNARRNEYRRDDTPRLPKGKMESQRQWKQNNNSRKNTDRHDTPENKELHPSWAAKIKQQEILKQGFQGKKIVFNND